MLSKDILDPRLLLRKNVLKEIYSEECVNNHISTLATALNKYYQTKLVMVCPLMTGAIILAGKLIPQLSFQLTIEPITLRRYCGKVAQKAFTGEKSLPSFQGKRVLLLDEMMDEGLTLARAVELAKSDGAVDVRTAVLLNRDIPRKIQPDFPSLVVDTHEYLVGEGLDYNGLYRNKRGVWAIK